MMRRVAVTGAGQSTVTIGDGSACGVIGSGRVGAGDVAWEMGGFVFSPGKKGNRPPIIWRKRGYRFADAYELKMRTVAEDLQTIISEEAINPPMDGAQLCAHTYNEKAEYLIWFVDSRCIIEKDGEKVSDFVSEFAYPPDEIDAYVDENDDLIWGAAAESSGVVTITARKNDSVVKSVSYRPDDIAAIYAGRINQRAAQLQYSVSVILETPTTDVSPLYGPGPLYIVCYTARYAGTRLKNEAVGSASARDSLSDVFGAESYLGISSQYYSQYVEWIVSAYGYSPSLGGFGDQSYTVPCAVTQLSNTAIHRISDGAIVAEMQEQHAGTEDVIQEGNTYSYETIYDVAGDMSECTGYAIRHRDGYEITASSFDIAFDLAGELVPTDMCGMLYEITGMSGENSGETRYARHYIWSNSNPRRFYFQFSSSWPVTPVAGDLFKIKLYTGIAVDHRTDCSTRTISSFPAAIEQKSVSVSTNIGNGYAIENTAIIENSYGYISRAGAVRYNGQPILSGEHVDYTGAWKTEDGKAIGVAGYEIIKADGAEVKLIEPQYNPNVATKRFV